MKNVLLLLNFWVVLFVASITSIHAQVDVTADHAEWIEFPLMKIYGVNIPDKISYTTLESNAPLLKDLDIRYVRVKNNWGLETAGSLFENPQITLSGDNVSIDFTQVDQVVNVLKENDVQILFMNGYTPAALDANWNSTPDTTDGGKWYSLNRLFAEHWVDKDLPGLCYEIWNGTDSVDFYAGDPKGYQVMVREAINGIQDATADAKVGGGAFFSGKANNFKNILAETGSMKLGNDLRVCNFMRFWTGQAEGLGDLKDMIERGDDDYGSFRRWIDWFDFLHWECFITGYAPYPLNSADAVNYKAANEFFETTLYMLRFSDVSRVYLNQLTDDTDGNKGLVAQDGTKTPLYYALKHYNQMPYDRKELSIGDADIHGFTSSDDKNAYLALWNVGNDNKSVNVNLNNLPFSSGNYEVFRIDESNNGEDAVATGAISSNSSTWSGDISSKGVVIIKVTTGESSMEANNFGKYVKDYHLWWFRCSQPWMWHTFDPKTMVAYLGDTASMPGNEDKVNWGVSSMGVYIEDIPTKFNVKVSGQGNMNWMDLNTQLVLRINFEDTLDNESLYAKSMVFYDDANFVFDPAHESNFCYEICAREDDQINVDFLSPDGFDVDLTEYASPFWAGNAVLIFGLQNPGTGKYYDTNPEEAGKGLMVKFEFKDLTEGPNIINRFNESKDLVVYPVPVTDVLNLKIPENIRGNMDISIIDISGRNILSQRHNDNPGTLIINTADLKEGIYLVRVAHSSGTFSSKILKSK